MLKSLCVFMCFFAYILNPFSVNFGSIMGGRDLRTSDYKVVGLELLRKQSGKKKRFITTDCYMLRPMLLRLSKNDAISVLILKKCTTFEVSDMHSSEQHWLRHCHI